MKPVQASAFIFSIVCGLSAGCERKGEPIPQGTPTPETPITPTRPVVPHINPAKPDMETDRVRTGTTLEGDPAAIAPSKDEQRQAKAKFKVVAGSKMSGDAKLTEDAN